MVLFDVPNVARKMDGKLKQYLCPRVYFYFDDIFDSSHCIDDQNGEL